MDSLDSKIVSQKEISKIKNNSKYICIHIYMNIYIYFNFWNLIPKIWNLNICVYIHMAFKNS